MQKLCKDCKFYQADVDIDYLNGKRDVCLKFVEYVDLVRGTSRCTTDKHTFAAHCVEQRAEISQVPNRCGVDGKFYEPK